MTLHQTNESTRIEWHFSLESSCNLAPYLLSDIRALLREKSDSKTKSSMLILLNRLIQNLPVLLELSSKSGCQSVVLKNRPSWSRQIAAMYPTNLDCVSAVKLARECLENDDSNMALAQAFELKLKDWTKFFSVMRYLDSTLFQEISMGDLGGEA